MEYTITLNEIPPNLNEIIFKAKRHWAIYATMKKAWKKLVNDCINPNWLPFLTPIVVEVTFYFNDKRSRDIDNMAGAVKLLLDGFTKKENPNKFLIPDDNENWIKDVHIKLRKGSERKTVIVLKEIIEVM